MSFGGFISLIVAVLAAQLISEPGTNNRGMVFLTIVAFGAIWAFNFFEKEASKAKK